MLRVRHAVGQMEGWKLHAENWERRQTTQKGKTMIHSVRGRVSQTPRSRPKSFLWRQCRTPFVTFCKIEGELLVPDAVLHMTTTLYARLVNGAVAKLILVRNATRQLINKQLTHWCVGSRTVLVTTQNLAGVALWILRNRDV